MRTNATGKTLINPANYVANANFYTFPRMLRLTNIHKCLQTCKRAHVHKCLRMCERLHICKCPHACECLHTCTRPALHTSASPRTSGRGCPAGYAPRMPTASSSSRGTGHPRGTSRTGRDHYARGVRHPHARGTPPRWRRSPRPNAASLEERAAVALKKSQILSTTRRTCSKIAVFCACPYICINIDKTARTKKCTSQQKKCVKNLYI